MAVKLRLRRMGKKKQPFYRVVAADKNSPRDGRFIETIGFYNPRAESETEKTKIDEERALYWLDVGAQPTDTVRSILSRHGILFKRDLKKQGLTEQQIEVKLDERNKLIEAKLASESKQEEKKATTEKVETKSEDKSKVESEDKTATETKAQKQEAEKSEAEKPESKEQKVEDSNQEAKDAASEEDRKKDE